jgi:hypothetical protein
MFEKVLMVGGELAAGKAVKIFKHCSIITMV